MASDPTQSTIAIPEKVPPATLRDLFSAKRPLRPHNVYTLRGGVRFCQEPLEYFELVECMEMIAGQLSEFTANMEKLGELIERLKKQELLPKLMRLILKPYGTTRTNKIVNRLLAWRYRVDLDNPVAAMTGQEMAGVLLDFFLLNLTWIAGFKNLQTPSSTGSATEKTWSMAEVFSLAWKLCTQPATGTSPEPHASDEPTPSSSASGS